MRLAFLTRASPGTGATGDAASCNEGDVMKPRKWRSDAPATTRTLDTVTLKRIQWLFERVCRHCYGAEPSLCAAVRLGAARMSTAGASREAIRTAIGSSVRGDPSHVADSFSLDGGESRVVAIRKRMVAWADAAITPDQLPS